MASDPPNCSLKAITKDIDQSSIIVRDGDGSWKTSSFYLDSSGRSSVALALSLEFPSDNALDKFLESTGIEPPTNEAQVKKNRWLSLESKVTLTVGSGEAVSACVEEMNTVSSWRQGSTLKFRTQIIMRVSRSNGSKLDMESAMVKTNLEVSAVLHEAVLVQESKEDQALRFLKQLDLLGASGISRAGFNTNETISTRLGVLKLHVSLTNGFSISVRSVETDVLGETLVALTMCHSNSHSEPVTITNISVHPGHSRLIQPEKTKQREQIMDMSNVASWGFSDGMEPNLPLTLNQYEAVSSIIRIIAKEDKISRSFFSPLSVTAAIGNLEDVVSQTHQHSVVAAADARWTSSRAIIRSDAFRVDLSVDEGLDVTVGRPFAVNLNVSNLSDQVRRNIILHLDNSEGESAAEEPQDSSSSDDVLVIRGLEVPSAEDFPDDKLLAVDESLLLDELQPQAAVKAQLRFIALAPGTLEVPNITLFDRSQERLYHCTHNVKVVST